MGRPPLEEKQRQIPVALPSHFRMHLEQAAADAGHSVAEEIRRRLERTFVEDAADQPTRDLLLKVKDLTALVMAQTGRDWYAHSEAWKIFRAAIITLIDRLQPAEPLGAEPKQPITESTRPILRLVAATDAGHIGVALEALSSFVDQVRSVEKKVLSPKGRRLGPDLVHEAVADAEPRQGQSGQEVNTARVTLVEQHGKMLAAALQKESGSSRSNFPDEVWNAAVDDMIDHGNDPIDAITIAYARYRNAERAILVERHGKMLAAALQKLNCSRNDVPDKVWNAAVDSMIDHADPVYALTAALQREIGNEIAGVNESAHVVEMIRRKVERGR
jgi:hypothetical protein